MHNFLANYLEKIIEVPFTLNYVSETLHIGKGEPAFTVTIKEEIPKKDLIASTSLALGEAYMKGNIEVDKDLYEVINLLLSNIDSFSMKKSLVRKIIYTRTSKKNQEKEVTSHYDIGNDFYSLWLDETMSYSCAYFKNGNDTLYDAQVNKVDHILEKLHLKKEMSLLDIGCGFGFLLKRAAKKYGVKGLGITLSKEQYNKFSKDIKREGLEGLVTVKLMDYRELQKSNLLFDRVVSVGMLEHVGRDNYPLFIQNVNEVLKDSGLFLLHFISELKESPGDPWIKKYIFPGGVIPSLREVISVMGNNNMYTIDVESLRRHYNKTLLCWRDNFLKEKDKIIEMQGIEFTRMWDVYLSSCAAAFNNGVVDLHQVLMSKGINNDIPLNRII